MPLCDLRAGRIVELKNSVEVISISSQLLPALSLVFLLVFLIPRALVKGSGENCYFWPSLFSPQICVSVTYGDARYIPKAIFQPIVATSIAWRANPKYEGEMHRIWNKLDIPTLHWVFVSVFITHLLQRPHSDPLPIPKEHP